MNKVYVNQSALRIQMDTLQDVSDAGTVQIKYIKPDGTTGTWAASKISDENTKIYYDLTGTELDQAGIWILYAYATFSDLRSAPGEPYRMRVYAEGS